MQEQVVAALERALAGHGARIRHDVRLRAIVTGRKRQFDVVVEAGSAERRITTVVEVQKRTGKVDLPTLQAWWAKAESVGAHQLVGVSEAGFTKGVVEEVQLRIGPRVRLVSLQELERGEWPINFIGGIVEVAVIKPTLQAGKTVILDTPDMDPVIEVPNVGFHDPLFYRDGSIQALSIAMLTHDAVGLTNELTQAPAGTYIRNLSIPSTPPLWVLHAGRLLSVRQLVVPAMVHVVKERLALQMSSYNQIGSGSSLAWIAVARGRVDGDDIETRVVLVPDEHGAFRVAEFETVGIAEEVQLLIAPIAPSAAGHGGIPGNSPGS